MVFEISTSTYGFSILYSCHTLVCTTWWWPSQRPKLVVATYPQSLANYINTAVSITPWYYLIHCDLNAQGGMSHPKIKIFRCYAYFQNSRGRMSVIIQCEYLYQPYILLWRQTICTRNNKYLFQGNDKSCDHLPVSPANYPPYKHVTCQSVVLLGNSSSFLTTPFHLNVNTNLRMNESLFRVDIDVGEMSCHMECTVCPFLWIFPPNFEWETPAWCSQ